MFTQKKDLNAQRGFTLLEMMIVVAIIAILAGILIPNFTRARAQAATSGCMANEKMIATALELYFTDHQAYPPAGNVDQSFVQSMSGYLNQIPVDPAAGAGHYYSYSTASDGGVTTYAIICPGPHDSGTLSTISGGQTTNTRIKYDSQAGFSSGS